jgi:hypothetical protein
LAFLGREASILRQIRQAMLLLAENYSIAAAFKTEVFKYFCDCRSRKNCKDGWTKIFLLSTVTDQRLSNQICVIQKFLVFKNFCQKIAKACILCWGSKYE